MRNHVTLLLALALAGALSKPSGATVPRAVAAQAEAPPAHVARDHVVEPRNLVDPLQYHDHEQPQARSVSDPDIPRLERRKFHWAWQKKKTDWCSQDEKKCVGKGKALAGCSDSLPSCILYEPVSTDPGIKTGAPGTVWCKLNSGTDCTNDATPVCGSERVSCTLWKFEHY